MTRSALVTVAGSVKSFRAAVLDKTAELPCGFFSILCLVHQLASKDFCVLCETGGSAVTHLAEACLQVLTHGLHVLGETLRVLPLCIHVRLQRPCWPAAP